MPRRRNGLARTRTMLTLPAPEPAAPPDPDKRDQAPVRYGTEGCRWCGGAVVRPRKTFCNDSCVHQFRLRSSGTYRRQAAYLQFGPVCSGCGVDTREIGRALRTDPETARRTYGLSNARRSRPRRLEGSVFDLDHTLPVAHGGGGCGLDNVRIFCPGCHAAVTWATRPRRGKKPSKCEASGALGEDDVETK
jgi:5-methylcytosine-specific restriction protein A